MRDTHILDVWVTLMRMRVGAGSRRPAVNSITTAANQRITLDTLVTMREKNGGRTDDMERLTKFALVRSISLISLHA